MLFKLSNGCGRFRYHLERNSCAVVRLKRFPLATLGVCRLKAEVVSEDNFSGKLVDIEQVHRRLQRSRFRIDLLRFGKHLGGIGTEGLEPVREHVESYESLVIPWVSTIPWELADVDGRKSGSL